MTPAFICTGAPLRLSSLLPVHGHDTRSHFRRPGSRAVPRAVLSRRLTTVPATAPAPAIDSALTSPSRASSPAIPAVRFCIAVARRGIEALACVAERVRAIRTNKHTRIARAGASLVLAAVGLFVSRGALGGAVATATATAAPLSSGAGPIANVVARLASLLPESARVIVRPFSEAFGVVFLSEFGDKSMFATALMAMKHSPFLVLLGALVALTAMTLIACFLGQLMHMLPARITHYSSIALFVFFGLQMIWQSRNLPDTPGGSGGERADAEELVGGAAVGGSGRLGILAKISSLIFVAEWCDRSMLATMALAASSNTAAVIGGATAANVLCTGLAVGAAALVSSRISERMVALVAGILFEVFAVFTFLEGPEEH